MKKWLYVSTLLFLFTLLPLNGEAAFEEIEEIKLVKANTLPLKPSITTIVTLHKDDVVYVSGAVKAGWIYAQFEQYEGYVNNSLLSEVIGEGRYVPLPFVVKKITQNNQVEMNGSISQSMQKGTLVTTLTKNGVSRNEVFSTTLRAERGWIRPSYLEIIPPTIRMTNATSGIVVKEKPSPSVKTLITIPAKIPFTSFGTVAGGWRIIQYGGLIGYVNAAAAVAVTPTTKYVAAQGLPLYETASRSANVHNILKQGTAVQAYSNALGWTYVRVGNLGGYVPTNMLVAKKPTLAKASTMSGWQMDAAAIQPNILQTQLLKDEKGKSVYVHTTSFGVGVQLAGEPSIFMQRAAGKETVLAQKLMSETGAFIVACDVKDLCQYRNGQLVTTIQGSHEMTRWGFPGVGEIKHFAKGQVQVLHKYYEQDIGETFVYTTFQFNGQTKYFEQVQQIVRDLPYWSTDTTIIEEAKRWSTEPTFFVK